MLVVDDHPLLPTAAVVRSALDGIAEGLAKLRVALQGRLRCGPISRPSAASLRNCRWRCSAPSLRTMPVRGGSP
ncbi:MAG: hypothetical protein J2P53_06000, partial [Bradyrhizobiaceae bacterium]|nr:hypothetical protein [Bradyrhizobiaceae bacterium]